MKVISQDPRIIIPDIIEKDFHKYLIISITKHYASYIVKDILGYRFKGIRILFDNDPVIWCDYFNLGSDTILNILLKEYNNSVDLPIIYLIENWEELIEVKRKHHLPNKFYKELKNVLITMKDLI